MVMGYLFSYSCSFELGNNYYPFALSMNRMSLGGRKLFDELFLLSTEL